MSDDDVENEVARGTARGSDCERCDDLERELTEIRKALASVGVVLGSIAEDDGGSPR